MQDEHRHTLLVTTECEKLGWSLPKVSARKLDPALKLDAESARKLDPRREIAQSHRKRAAQGEHKTESESTPKKPEFQFEVTWTIPVKCDLTDSEVFFRVTAYRTLFESAVRNYLGPERWSKWHQSENLSLFNTTWNAMSLTNVGYQWMRPTEGVGSVCRRWSTDTIRHKETRVMNATDVTEIERIKQSVLEQVLAKKWPALATVSATIHEGILNYPRVSLMPIYHAWTKLVSTMGFLETSNMDVASKWLQYALEFEPILSLAGEWNKEKHTWDKLYLTSPTRGQLILVRGETATSETKEENELPMDQLFKKQMTHETHPDWLPPLPPDSDDTHSSLDDSALFFEKAIVQLLDHVKGKCRLVIKDEKLEFWIKDFLVMFNRVGLDSVFIMLSKRLHLIPSISISKLVSFFFNLEVS